jgi:hypothetical protein
MYLPNRRWLAEAWAARLFGPDVAAVCYRTTSDGGDIFAELLKAGIFAELRLRERGAFTRR